MVGKSSNGGGDETSSEDCSSRGDETGLTLNTPGYGKTRHSLRYIFGDTPILTDPSSLGFSPGVRPVREPGNGDRGLARGPSRRGCARSSNSRERPWFAYPGGANLLDRACRATAAGQAMGRVLSDPWSKGVSFGAPKKASQGPLWSWSLERTASSANAPACNEAV